MAKQKNANFQEWVEENGFNEGDLQRLQHCLGKRTIIWFFLGFTIIFFPFFVETWAWYKRVKQRTFQPKPGIIYSLCRIIMFFYMFGLVLIWFVVKSPVVLIVALIMWISWFTVRLTTIGTGLRRVGNEQSSAAGTSDGRVADINDPNTWTGSFVSTNRAECLRFLRETTSMIVDFVQQKNYLAAIAGLDRVLNGLIIMQNAKCGDFRSHLAMFSMCEGSILAFGINDVDVPESKQREAALKLFEDARDFSKSEQTRQFLQEIAADFKSGVSLKRIKDKYGSDFPQSVIDILADLNNKLFQL